MYQLLLCVRYLRTRYIALASIISVMLGVATMIVVNSVMAGFSSEMRERIHGILADVVVETHSLDGVPDAEAQMQTIRDVCGDQIAGMTATVEVYAMMSFQYRGHWITRPVTLIGIDPESKAEVGPLKEYLDSYRRIEEDGRVIRQPLRQIDEVPGWALTPEALAYRKQWKERQQLIQQRRFHDPASPPSMSEPPVFDGEADLPAEAGEAPDFAGEAPEQPAVVSGPNPIDLNPFGNSGGTMEVPDDFDPTAPLPARLYVGQGLVSYLVEDQKTGRNETEMMVQPGDDVKISTVSSGRPPEPRNFNATIVDVLKTGMSEYDSNLVLCNLDYLQEARGMIDPSSGVRSITSIQIKLRDYDDAAMVVKRLQSVFPPGVFSVRTWEQKQGPLLAAVEVESAILNVLLFLIIAVAGFGILAIFYMIVVEKTRDIGILKALGASSAGVMKIFLSYGLALGIVGSGVGVGLGLLFVRYINVIESWITWMTGRKVFDEKIYYFPEIPTSVHPSMVLWVAFGAMLIAVLASVLPARRASQLKPVESLRYE